MNDDLLLFDEEPAEAEAVKMSEDIREAMNAMLDAYVSDGEYDDNLWNILEEDDHLTEELVDKLALLNLIEGAEKNAYSDEDIERAYLSVIDSLFELSKLISPLNGFGKDRLLAGLSLIRQFEEQHWLVSTRIVPENAEAFSELISAEHYDDIITGRKKGIGALRHVGDEVYAAGAVVYSVYDDDEDLPRASVDWIMVHENLREQGIANFLMALAIEDVFKFDEGAENEAIDAFMSVELPVKPGLEFEELRETDALENLFDSWKFGFTMNYGSKFVIALSDVGDPEAVKKKAGKNKAGVKSLAELGKKGEKMLKAFWKKRSAAYDADLAALPYDFFDRDVSCAACTEEEIGSILLFHRYENGDYRYECFRSIEELDLTDLPGMVAFACEAAKLRQDGDHMIFGMFASEEGYEAAAKLLPKARIPMVYNGALYAPDEVITSEEWGRLREKAGLSNDKIPKEGVTDDDMEKNEKELMKEYIAGNGLV